MRFGEFVALMAMVMAVNALGVDMMLPALPALGAELGVTVENHRQWVIAIYMAGFSVMQLVYGPLADRYGRRPILIATIATYALMSLIASVAASFALLLIARLLQGMASASTRVLSVSVVRDCYGGRTMARVMSLCTMVFLAVPILAPSLGQLVLLFAPWRGIFYALAGFSGLVALWVALRLPETLHPEDRRAITVGSIATAMKQTVTNRYSLGYTLCIGCMFTCIMSFINSAEQVFVDVFDMERGFPLVFAGIAGTMAVAALVNSRIVERYGMRKVSHTALIGIIAINLIHLAVIFTGHETIVTFAVLQGLMMFFFNLTGSNFNAMAMEPMAHIAGTASSVQGFLSTMLGVIAGFFVGQAFNGTTLPLVLGFTGAGVTALVIVLIVERGRLFHGHIANRV
ncbi:MFS transporter [Sphingomonas crocodyli]|uniref:MFS transporter n=2 Tax=Sphingomonas crocodyli TaxID=1979270 RepID=A0A437MBX0_9SPHN|nr:multidrug effflux MFS transporter [Sphingomonas crocodyli]RVT95125.1 MFS transporter [Sphingomonas crocodyli]